MHTRRWSCQQVQAQVLASTCTDSYQLQQRFLLRNEGKTSVAARERNPLSQILIIPSSLQLYILLVHTCMYVLQSMHTLRARTYINSTQFRSSYTIILLRSYYAQLVLVLILASTCQQQYAYYRVIRHYGTAEGQFLFAALSLGQSAPCPTTRSMPSVALPHASTFRGKNPVSTPGTGERPTRQQ